MKKIFSLFVFLPAAFFPLAALVIGLRNQAVFNANPIIPCIVIVFTALIFFRERRLQRDNQPGLLLFLFFTFGYYLLASVFNKPEINTNNIYFAADSWSWLQRMAFEDGWYIGTRAVHPFAHILFRPIVWLLTSLTGGDRFQANLLLLALAGGACIFLMWKIIKQISGDENSAVLFASILGLSASHLIFASVIESYIFSTLCLLFFIWLTLSDKSIYLLAATSVTTLGITVTNIVQQGLVAMLAQRNLRRVIMLFTLAIVGSVALNVSSRFIYPATEYFFVPQNLTGEQRFAQEITVKRVGLMAENLLIYNIAAPQPFTSIRNEMPRFNFLNSSIRDYFLFGWLALTMWITTLGLALFYFFKNIRQIADKTYLAPAMLACLLFNFLLHIGYGTEPFLYSADWTYALILFAAISLRDLVKREWFSPVLFILTTALFINNLWFVYLLARKASDFLV